MTDKQGRGLTLTQLEALCSRWQGVVCDVKWSDNSVFSVGGKMFAMMSPNGGEGGRLSFKVDDDRFLALTDRPGIIPAPYLARAHWISITEPQRFATSELAAFVLDAYALIRANLTKKLQAELGPLPALGKFKP